MAKEAKPATFEAYDLDSLSTYAGIDCIATSAILKKMWPQLVEQPTYYLHKGGNSQQIHAPSLLSEIINVKSQALDFMVDLECNGFAYDIEGNYLTGKAMLREIEILEENLHAIVGEGFNYRSDEHLLDLLYGKYGFEPPLFTKTGQPSASGDALKALMKKHPEHKWLGDMRKRNDLESTYNGFIGTYVKDYVKRDGRIHPNYNLHGTSSHRISSDTPNLLNLAGDVHGYNLRTLYTVEEGNVLICFDFSSCEVKVLAALSGDPKMKEAILAGLDFHSYTASLMYGIPYDTIAHAVEDDKHPEHKHYKKLRQGAKAVTFGLLYGSSVASIAKGLEVSTEEAQKIVDAYFNAYPRVREFIDDQHNNARLNHFVYSPFAQRKRQFGAMPVFQRTAVYNAAMRNSQNVQIQGPASTAGLMAFMELRRQVAPLGAKVICTVYDSVEIECPVEVAAEVIEKCFYAMDDWPVLAFDWLDFPIGCDGEIGWNWGFMKKVKRGVTQEEVLESLHSARKATDEYWANVGKKAYA